MASPALPGRLVGCIARHALTASSGSVSVPLFFVVFALDLSLCTAVRFLFSSGCLDCCALPIGFGGMGVGKKRRLSNFMALRAYDHLGAMGQPHCIMVFYEGHPGARG